MKRIALLTLLVPSLAGATELATPPPTPQPIYNGTLVEACGWPSVVSMESSCSGTLVHPRVVVYAGHCGASYQSVQFGEDGVAAARSVDTDDCWALDGVGEGQDFAVCRLAAPVEDIPIVPILMGCEVDVLQPGVGAALIGFGQANNGPYGFKRETTSQIESFSNDEAFLINDKMQDACYGDSGGPAMVQLADGTWRVFGVTSYGPSDECGNGTYYSMLHNGVGWIEEMTGIDVTPCHTVEGVWDPGPACGGFPLMPADPVGSWPGMCQIDGPRGGPSSTCGPAFDAEQDEAPPLVEITSPKHGTKYMAVKTLPLTITASARDDLEKPESWGVTELRLIINDKEVAGSARHVAPYTWDLELPPGGYLLGAVAVDHAGNEGFAAPVAIGVNVDPPALPEPPDATTSETGDVDTGDDTTGEPTPTTGEPEAPGSSATGADTADTTDLEGADDGCGCRSRGAPGPLGLLAVGLLLGLRRRGLARTGKAR